MSLVSEVAAYLIAGGYATALGTDIFVRELPPSPLNAVLLLAGPNGTKPIFYSSGAIDHYRLTVQVRNTDPKTAEDNAEAIRLLLDDEELGGYWLKTDDGYPGHVSDEDDIRAGARRFQVEFTIRSARGRS